MLDSYFLIFRAVVSLAFGLATIILFLGGKLKNIDKIVVGLFFVFLLVLQIFCWQQYGLKQTLEMYPVITHLPITIFLIIYFKSSWLISISSVLTGYLCCQIPRWVGSLAFDITGIQITNHIGYFIAISIVYIVLKRYVYTSVRQVMRQSKQSCMIFTSVPLLYYIFDYFTTRQTNLTYSGTSAIGLFTPSMICTIYMLFVIVYNYETQKQTHTKLEKDIIVTQLQHAQLELDTMRQMHDNTVIYRHDMRHHLSLIGSYAKEGDIQKITDYLAITEEDIDAMTPVHYCQNETVNLILSNFDQRAKKLNVLLQTKVNLPDELLINDVELCTLLSNALENAITAASKMEGSLRKVSFKAIVRDRKLVISTENAFCGIIEMEGDLPKSTKSDNHGYGIKSMAAIVDRYGGLYSVEAENGKFILQLLLPLKGEKILHSN